MNAIFCAYLSGIFKVILRRPQLFVLLAPLLALPAQAADTIVFVQDEAEAMARAKAIVSPIEDFREGQGNMCRRLGYYKLTAIGACYSGSGNCTVNTSYIDGPNCANYTAYTLKTGFIYPLKACPAGKKFVGPTRDSACIPEALVDAIAAREKQLGLCKTPGASTTYGNPCDASTGNKIQVEEDFVGGYGIPSYRRYFNSLNPEYGAFGVGWSFSYSRRIDVQADQAIYHADDGAVTRFYRSGSDWVTDPDVRMTLTRTPSEFVIRRPDGSSDTFSRVGELQSEVSPLGLVTQVIRYGVGRKVVGPFGHTIKFEIDNRDVTLPTGDKIRLGSNNSTMNADLVIYSEGPDGRGESTYKRYLYESDSAIHGLTGIQDEDGIRRTTYNYDSTTGLASGTSLTGGVQAFSLSHAGNVTTVTNGNGGTDTLTFATNLGIRHMVSKMSSADGKTLTQEFDAFNRLSRSVDEEGSVTSYTYDSAVRMTSRTEAEGTQIERTTVYDYTGQTGDNPTTITEPGRTTQIQYGPGNLPIYVATTASGVTRATSYTYTAAGQLSSIDGPRTDVSDITTFTYW